MSESRRNGEFDDALIDKLAKALYGDTFLFHVEPDEEEMDDDEIEELWQKDFADQIDYYKTANYVLRRLSRDYTILPISDYNDLFDRSEKLKRIEWQMNNPCQNCGGDCLECQHYEDKRRYGW